MLLRLLTPSSRSLERQEEVPGPLSAVGNAISGSSITHPKAEPAKTRPSHNAIRWRLRNMVAETAVKTPIFDHSGPLPILF